MTTALLVFLSFAAVAALIPPVCRAAVRTRFVDRPGGRKGHRGAVPPVGGLVVVPVFLLGAGWLSAGHVPGFYAFAAAMVMTLVVGALDDARGLPARIKFFMQFAAASVMVVGGHAAIASLGDLFGFGPFGLGPASIPFSIVAAVLLMNAVNLMDGLDGLAGGIAFTALFWFAVSCALTGGGAVYLPALLVLMAALAGFLFYNMRHPLRARASVFLGDAGSLSLGLALAWFSMKLADINVAAAEPISIAWILALPIMDTCGQFARRVREGRHPFDADQHHFHHHFIAVGVPVNRAVAAILGIAFVSGGIGVAGIYAGLPVWGLTCAWTALLLAHIYMSLRPVRMHAFLSGFTRR